MIRMLFLMLVALLFALPQAEATDAVDWKSQWIWQQEDGPANAWVAFRKKVDLDSVPALVTANISADSKYWLWINGKLVVFEGSVARGPSPHAPWDRLENMWDLPPEAKPSNTWYEEIDITPHLKRGENTIAALVWYWGRETHKGTHVDSGKGGFLFQANIGSQTVVTDKSWKLKSDPAYALDSGDVGKNILQYNVKYDARKELGDWTSPNYSDANWSVATEKGLPPVAPWYELEKSYVPSLVNHGLQNYENFPASKFPFTCDGKTVRCVLPFNKQMTPYLEVETDEGKQIEITTDNRHNKISGYYTTKEGKQSFESYAWMSGHEVHYEIPAGVKVLALKYRWMSVGKMVGEFECSDPFYQRIWWMGRNTLFVCARDNFMDCPDRERACWIGDVADQASYLFYCMDEAGRQLLKKAIRVTMAYSHGGVYASLGPLRLRELPTQSLQFVEQCVWQYYLNTGDEETLRYAYPYIREYLALWEMEPTGLPKYRRGGGIDMWDWSDWGQKETLDKAIIQPALYYMALKNAMKMAELLDKPQDVLWYEERIESIKKSFDKRFWKGEFYSSNPAKFQDDRANCLTILAGLANAEQQEAIATNVLIPNYFCSPHFEWMVEEALCLAGKPEAALKRMKDRYQSQVDRKNMSTLYEMFPNGGTYNHAWNSPNSILSKYIAGVSPLQPGWSEFQILPSMTHLTSIKTLVPSVKGNILIGIKRDDKSFDIELESPPEATAIVGVPKSYGRVSEVSINGVVVWKQGVGLKEIAGVDPVEEDANFLKFRVQPGTWKLSASYL